MLIQLQGVTAENVGATKHSIQALAQSWGYEISHPPAEVVAAAGTIYSRDDKVIDPVSLTALVLSIPPAALAAFDLADRIQKRRRAKELIDSAQRLASQQVTIYLISPGRIVELSTLSPDQLLDLANEDSAI
jgi:hypothetical protein